MGAPERPAADTRALYPFLDPRDTGGTASSASTHDPAEDADPVVAGPRDIGAADPDLIRSAADKAGHIVRLRRQVADLHSRRIAECARAMADRFAAGGRLFTFGNGGSSTDAQELAVAFLRPHAPYQDHPLPAICLTTDAAVVTALSNDVGFPVVFARQLAALARPGDIAIGLSTSGGSVNVVRAFEEAARRGMLTVALAGGQGGKLADLGLLDFLFVIPSSSVHRVQEAQTTVYHVLWELTQRAMRSHRRAPEDLGGEQT